MEPASILGGKFVRPHLRAVEHAQEANSIGVDQIGRDLGRARNDQLARAIDAPGPAAVRKVEQAPRGIGDLFVDMNRCTRTFSFDMAENIVAIRQREARPDMLHRLRSAALRSAAARRRAKCASTSESSRSGRVSASAWRTFSRNQLS